MRAQDGTLNPPMLYWHVVVTDPKTGESYVHGFFLSRAKAPAKAKEINRDGTGRKAKVVRSTQRLRRQYSADFKSYCWVAPEDWRAPKRAAT